MFFKDGIELSADELVKLVDDEKSKNRRKKSASSAIERDVDSIVPPESQLEEVPVDLTPHAVSALLEIVDTCHETGTKSAKGPKPVKKIAKRTYVKGKK